jgi:hypothetical protein
MLPATKPAQTFRSFFLAGFECSTHLRRDGSRLDLIDATGHSDTAETDYRALGELGIKTVRDGLRWHLIERTKGQYDWSSFLPMLRAAERTGTEVIWDLCHYGWPEDVDIWSGDFIDRFARFSSEVARIVAEETGDPPFYCPVNEISFWAWAGGEVARLNPYCTRSGGELKRQLVRAWIAAVDVIRTVDPRARFITAEPLIHVDPGYGDDLHRSHAQAYRVAQFEALDMIAGTLEPSLGGAPDLLDIIGVNYYPDNQWYHAGSTIPLGHHAYRPLSDMLAEVFARYGRPVLISETGAEGSARAAWLNYVSSEARGALERGVPVTGICLYPILDYPGWDNDRHCHVGLLSTLGASQGRNTYFPLAEELERQQRGLFADSAQLS